MLKINIQLFAVQEPVDNTAKTNESEIAVDTQEKVGENQPEVSQEAKPEEQEPVNTEVADRKAKEEQDKAERARQAQIRREKEKAEAIAKAQREIKVETIKEIVKVNPYTNKEIQDADDVDIYLTMKRIEEDGGDPVTDYATYQKEALRKVKADELSKQRIEQDISDFKSTYPNVNVNELFSNEDFNDYADGKLGPKTLKEVYESYTKFIDKYTVKNIQEPQKENNDTEDKENKEALLEAKRLMTGSISGVDTPLGTYYTLDQIDNMSQKEVIANIDKVNESIEYWRKNKR